LKKGAGIPRTGAYPVPSQKSPGFVS